MARGVIGGLGAIGKIGKELNPQNKQAINT